MARNDFTPRSLILLVIGVLSFSFFVRGSMSLWEHKFSLGFALLLGAALLTLFFGKHKIMVLYIGVSLMWLSAGMSALVGPNRLVSLAAFVLLGAAVVILTRRISQRPQKARTEI